MSIHLSLNSAEVVGLLRNCHRREATAQENLYRNYYPFARNIALGYADDEPGAEDIVQDAFIKLFDYLSADKQRQPFGLLALGLLFGLGVGVPAGAFYFAAECPADTQVGQSYVDAEVSKTGVDPVLTVPSSAPSTSTAPAAAPEKKSLPATAPFSQNDHQPAENEVTTKGPHYTIQTVVASNEDQRVVDYSDIINEPTDLPGVPEHKTGLTKPGNVEEPIQTPDGVAIHQVPGILNLPLKSARSGSLQSRLAAAAALSPTNPVEVKRRVSQPLARWEFGAYLYPDRSEATTRVATFSEMDNGSRPQQFDFGNREVTLYATGNLFPELDRRLRVNSVNFELARQFSNGLRLGLGVAWTPPQTDGLLNEREYLNEQLLPGNWATYSTFKTQAVYTSARLEYTFLRRRRFRPYAGVSFQSLFFTKYKFQQRLFERNSENSETINSTTFTSTPVFGRLQVSPLLGFQYELSERFSAGLEYVPRVSRGFVETADTRSRVGLGCRYRL